MPDEVDKVKIPQKARVFILYMIMVSTGSFISLIIMQKYFRGDIERISVTAFDWIFLGAFLVWLPSTIISGGWGVLKIIAFINSKKGGV